MVLKIRLIPSISLMNGIAVKSKNFKTYRNIGSYINAIRVYNLRDVDELIFLDIKATEEKRTIPAYVVKEISEETDMPLTIGGGIKTIEQMKKLFHSSADKISLNSEAIITPRLIKEAADFFGSANIVVSIDAKKVGDKYYAFTDGGKTNSFIEVSEWATKCESLGAGEIFLTSIDKDGTMTGFDIELIKTVTEKVKIPVIASGGAGKPEDFIDPIKIGGASAVSAASIFHFTQFTPREVKECMAQAGIPVRLE